jgi:5'-3' exonuclease
MISIFRENNIIPIFVFDGKPPAEKNDTIAFRKKTKINARDEYYRLKQILDDIESDVAVSDCESANDGGGGGSGEETVVHTTSNTADIRTMMDKLKKKFVILKAEHIQNAKTLLQAYGMTYIESPGEADMLCAKLVSKNIVYACLSEDTDMFVYGCSRVLRYLSLTTSTVILYDFQEIIKTLDMTTYEFRQLCIIYGCDYLPKNENQNYKNMTIFNSYKMFKSYKDYLKNRNENNEITPETEPEPDFYKWLLSQNTDIYSYINEACKVIDMFDISSYDNLELYDNIKIMNGPIHREQLIEVMQKENFIFIK